MHWDTVYTWTSARNAQGLSAVYYNKITQQRREELLVLKKGEIPYTHSVLSLWLLWSDLVPKDLQSNKTI